MLVEGVRAVREALDAGAQARFAVASPRLGETAGGPELLLALGGRGVEVEEVSDEELAGWADTEHPQGVLLVCAEPDFRVEAMREGGRWLILDALQDPGNAGTLVRAAVAFGLDGVVSLDGTVDLWGAKAVRASAGMVFRLPILSLSVADVQHRARIVGLAVLAADMGGRDVSRMRPPTGWALVVGNEGRGVRPELLESAASVRVPMPGPAESLNAAVAGSIMIFALTAESARASAP